MKKTELRPSLSHRNRKFYNWLVYDLTDKFLVKYSGKFKGTLYDFGCGERFYETFILQYADQYIGIDWSNTLHNLNADIVANLNQPLPLEDKVADSIFSISVIEHLSEPNVMLSEAFRILKDNGNIVLQVPFMWHIHEEPYDFYRYTRYGLHYMFEKAGFSDIRIEPMTGFWINWFLKLNYQLILLIRGSQYRRMITKPPIFLITGINLYIGKFLDKIWYSSEKETQGYWVTATKENKT